MVGFSTTNSNIDSNSTTTTFTYVEDDDYVSTTVSGSAFKEEPVIKEKEYTKIIDKVRLKPLPEHKRQVLKRKTARATIAPMANKGWKGSR